MGVLAKAWLAKFVPATTRREAADAYHRYKLDKQAELWYLEEVITLVPLLVQIASFLFLGGLVVQSITDDQTLGHALLAFCISGCVTYLTMTLLPLFVASSPFNTPLSDLLVWLGKMLAALFTLKWPSNSGRQVKTDINEGLAEILYTKLIKSPKPTYVDEAATEIALPSFKRNWIDYLCRNDTPQHLLTRFRQCSSTRTDNAIKRNETLCSHVLAFLQLVDHLEDKISTNPKDTSVEDMLPDYKLLLSSLRASLESGYPLHRWNNLPESLRPLSFGLRTQILSLFKPLPEDYRKGKDSTLIELDFHSNEMSDRPWELACQEIRSTHRLHFMLAACRGVLQGEKNVKTTSAFILGLCLAKAGCSASETGRTSEWAGNIEAKERAIVDSLALEFLSQLYAATMNELEDMAAAALNDISSLSPGFEISAAHPRQGILETLFSTLTLPHRALRVHTIKMLNQVSDLKPDLFNTGSIEIISNMTVYEDEDIREDGLQILATLVKSSEEMMPPVTTALLASVESGFNHEPQQRLRTVAFVRTVWDDSSSPFYSLVVQFIPGLVEVAMNADSTDVRQPALRLTKDVWAREFLTEIRSAIAKTLNAGLDSPESGKRYHIVTDLSELLKDDGTKDASEKPPYAFAWYYTSDLIVDIFPVVFEKIVRAAIHDDDSSVRETAKTLLKDLSKDGRVSSMLKADALTWLETAAVQPSWWWVRHNAVLVSETFINQLDLTNEDFIKKLVELAGTDEDDDVRRSSVKLISTICKDHYPSPEILEVVKSTILSVKEGLKESVDKVLKGIAKDVRDGIEAKPPPKPVETDANTQESESQAQDETEYDGAMDYMPQSTLKLPLRRLLYKIGWDDRRTWADILATISAHFPLDFQDAHTILFQMAKYDSDTDFQYACLKSLILLAKQSVTRELTNDTIKHFDDFSDNSDWRVRFSYTQLLSSVGVSKEVDLSDEVLKKLSTRALLDSDYDCRSEVVNTFLNLLEIEDSDRDPSPKERYRAYVETMVKEHFHDGIEDGSWKVRQSWIKLAGTQVKDAEFPELAKLFDASIKDSDSDVQAETMKVLQRLLEDAKLRASIAAKLGKSLGSCLSATEYTDRAVSVLSTITTPPYDQEDGYGKDLRERHQLWIQIILLLGRNVEFQALPKLIEVVIKEERSDTTFESQDALYSLFQNVKLPDSIDSILPKAIESALKLDAPFNVRSAAVNLFGRLIGCVSGRDKGDPQIISRLADIVIKDEYDDVRIAALRILKAAYKATDLFRFRDAIKASVSKVIENSLKDLENSRLRTNAVSAVDSLTEENSNDQFRDLVSPSISQLLRTVLLEGDENLGNSVERVLFGNFTAATAETKLNRDVLIAIPPMAATLTVAGKAIVMRLTGNLAISDDTAATIAHALTPMLRNTSSFARATAIELLLKLYTKHRHSKPRLIESAIPEIISLAFDDKDDVGGIRITAIQLLVALSSGPASLESLGEGQPEPSTATTSSVLKQITPLATKFMALLQVEHLRPSVVELLSLMSLDPTVRQTIMLRIASMAFGPETLALVGHVELLSRLLSDGRLGEKATDYMTLFLAPALVARPQLAPYRLKILTALWCRYGRRTLEDTDAPEKNVKHKELLEWFTLALFGRHATGHEATTWRTRCEVWLSATRK
ncbi:hypothetical protein EST38_g994 [Candolleomyces aberdarensis]|uniref:DUF6535 domain-containing protein n=1 Tax=Candolleomyces aberdarensis TaxID=2316362 RepID=A0A4Q2DWX8_9AGAR|nr:hypothetical protein EST38_g994 [Candolleomyces aberdarensis]